MIYNTTINITCENPDVVPYRAYESDAGADLVVKDDIYLPKGVRTFAKTGVSVEIPEGYVGLLVPRSSLSKNYIFLTNSVGIIDSSYRGELMASLIYNGDLDYYFLQKNTRIVQLVIVPIILPKFNVVEYVSATERGQGGFGSTG